MIERVGRGVSWPEKECTARTIGRSPGPRIDEAIVSMQTRRSNMLQSNALHDCMAVVQQLERRSKVVELEWHGKREGGRAEIRSRRMQLPNGEDCGQARSKLEADK